MTVRLEPLPPNTIPLSGIRAGFEDEALTFKELAALSGSPTVKDNGPIATFLFQVWFGIAEMVGG